MLETLITSKSRLRLLFKLFVDPKTEGYLRGFATEFGDSTNAIRKELNHLYEAKFLIKNIRGNRVYYRANTQHPLYTALHKLVKDAQTLKSNS